MIEKNDVPNHWVNKKLRDVCKELQSGKRPKGGVQGIEFGIPSLGAEHLDFNGGFKFKKIKFVPKEFAEQMKRGVVLKGDIIVVKDGATTGKTSFVGSDFPYDFAVINEHVFIIRLNEEILPKYAFYKLFSSSGHKEILEDFRGAAQGGISSGFLDKVNIPFPPLPEQRAIVDKIEELLSDLENGKQQLLTAQEQLKVYRQSLLKWGFEGKLTNNMVKDGELPKGWKWVKLEELANAIDPQPSHRTPPVSSDGIPYVSTKDFDYKSDQINFNQARQVSKSVLMEHLERYKLEHGDFVIGKIGTIGQPVRVVLPQNYTLSANIVLIQPRKVNSKYLYYYFQSNQIEKDFIKGQKATAQAAFGIQKVRTLQIPFPLLTEQIQIVDELESRLTVCDKIEETINQSLRQTEVLRQSILKRAFEGQLK